MVKYICSKCTKTFSQKGHYDSHCAKKIDCDIGKNIDKIVDKIVEKKVVEILEKKIELNNSSNVGITLNDFLNSTTLNNSNTTITNISTEIDKIKMPPKSNKKNITNNNVNSWRFQVENCLREKGEQTDQDGNMKIKSIMPDLIFLVRISTDEALFKTLELEDYMRLPNMDNLEQPNMLSFCGYDFKTKKGFDINKFRGSDDTVNEDGTKPKSVINEINKKIFKGYKKPIYNFIKISGLSQINSIDCIIKILLEAAKKEINDDVITEVFEGLIKDVSAESAKKGGQFYSSEKCAEYLVNELKPIIKPNGEPETTVDPFVGAGVLLIKAIKYIIKNNPTIDMYKVINSVYGVDNEALAYKNVLLRFLLEFKYIPKTLYIGDSFCIYSGDNYNKSIQDESYSFKDITYNLLPINDIGIMNPPFGCKSNWDLLPNKITTKVSKNINTKFFEIKSGMTHNVAVQLLLERTKSRGAIILQTSILDSSKNDDIAIRKMMSEKHNIYKITYLPKDYKNTTISTVAIFYKKDEVTKKIEFFEIENVDSKIWTDKKKGELTFEQISNHKDWTWDMNSYKEVKEINYKYPVKPLKDIINKTGSGKTNSKDADGTGNIDFYSCSAQNPSNKHSTYDFNDQEYFLFLTSGGNSKNKCGENLGIGKFIYIKGKSAAMVSVYQYKINENISLTYEFLDIMLKLKLFDIQNCGKYSVGLGHIEMDKMMNTVKIPIPPIENQKIIVDVFNKIAPNKDLAEFMKFYNNSIDIMNIILSACDGNSKELEDYLTPIYNYYMQIKNAIANYEMAKYSVYIRYMSFPEDTEIKRLGDLFELKAGKSLAIKDFKEGNIRVIGGGFTDTGTHNESNLGANTLTIAKAGESLGYTQYIDNPVFVTNNCYKVILKEKININIKYLYYYLKYNYRKYNKIRDVTSGTPTLNDEKFLQQYIYTPTLEIQKQIVENIEKSLKFQEDYYNNIKNFI